VSGDVGSLVTVILSVGGAAFVAAVFQGVRDLRAGARAGRGEVIHSQREWIVDLESRLRSCEADRDFYQLACAARGAALRAAGLPVPRLPPPPGGKDPPPAI
jgi:hypothetical protein